MIKNEKRLIFSNISYLGGMQIVNYVFPLITIPYLVRTLSKEDFGIYSLILIIMGYVAIVLDYGFNLTATREIAVYKDDKITIDHLASHVFYIKGFFIMILCVLGGVCTIFNFIHPCIIFSVIVFGIGQAVFPVWFLQGVENMRMISIFNTCSKLIFTFSIFFFIKKSNDAPFALLLYAAGVFISGMLSFLFVVKKYKLKFVKMQIDALRKLIIDGFDIFLTSLFSNVIISGGTLVLGFFGGTVIVGVYSAIEKIARAIIGVLSAITQVIYPNIARTLAKDKKAGIQKIKKTGSWFMPLLGILIVIIMFFSEWILKLLYGNYYERYTYVLWLLLVWVFIAFINNFIGIQFLVGSGYNKYYRKAFLITTVYIVFSFLFIKFFLINGLVFSILSGEIFLTAVMLWFIKRNRLLKG